MSTSEVAPVAVAEDSATQRVRLDVSPAFDRATSDLLLRAAARLPEAGQQFLDFDLVRELGRGAFARVFLARQAAVCDRPVVVKVAADVAGEVRLLAQLQHTNIVPVYSVHRDDALQVVCMPYLGDHTLEALAARLRAGAPVPATGAALADLCRADEGPSRAPAVERMRGQTYVDAVLDVAVRLAEGLAHAHDHGVIHCDIKPANVLLTGAGQPMLLDFNVGGDARAGGAVAVAGGSLPYMAPEQLVGFAHHMPAAVDARCDLYAFGALLYELLTGRRAHEAARSSPDVLEVVLRAPDEPPPPVRQLNPAVRPAFEAIVQRCLQPVPVMRYRSAAELLEDLRRQRDDRPLAVAGNPSVPERIGKFNRRHPRLAAAGVAAALASALLLAVGGVAAGYRHKADDLQATVAAAAALDAFQADARVARFKLYARTQDIAQARAGIAAARSALNHFDGLTAADRTAQTPALAELHLLLARAVTLPQAPDEPDAQRRSRLEEAWQLNARATELADRSPAVWAQRAELAAARGDAAAAKLAGDRAAALPPQSARDFYWLASEHVARGRPRQALPLLRAATRREPQNVWAWFVLGNCHDRLGQDAKAEACYSTCVALEPDFTWAYFDRGLARLRLQQSESAREDFDRCLDLDPAMAEARVNRALACQALGRFAEADRDLTAALAAGLPETRLYFLRARVRDMLGDAAGAAADRAEGMRREPTDDKSWLARGMARLANDPQAALGDFVAAAKANPRSLMALQNQAHALAERLGRTQEAVAVLDRAAELAPDSGMVLAGRGVLLARLGRADDARRDAREALVRDADAPRRYQVAGIYALTSLGDSADGARALALLASALRDGYGSDLIATDSDLDPLRGLPEFRALADAADALRKKPATTP